MFNELVILEHSYFVVLNKVDSFGNRRETFVK